MIFNQLPIKRKRTRALTNHQRQIAKKHKTLEIRRSVIGEDTNARGARIARWSAASSRILRSFSQMRRPETWTHKPPMKSLNVLNP